MSDLDRFLALYRTFGIDLTPDQPRDGRVEVRFPPAEHLPTRHPMIVGYAGFYTSAFFTEDGVFLEQGAWE